MSVLPSPLDYTQYLAWCLESAFLASRPENRMCLSTAYQNTARREGFGLNEEFWLDEAKRVAAHFRIKE